MINKSFVRKTGFVFLFIVLSLFFLLPSLITFTSSFMSETELCKYYGAVISPGYDYNNSGDNFIKLIPDEFSMEQYIALFETEEQLTKYWNSILYVIPMVLIQPVVSTTASYGFTRWRSKTREIIFFIYMVIMILPYQVTLVPNYLVCKWLGILNTRSAIILPGVFAPFSVFLLTRFMRRVPHELIEAAKLDGANEWQIFTKVFLPQCIGPLMTVLIIIFVDYWNMVEQPLVLLSDAAKHPLSVFLSFSDSSSVGSIFASATIYMLPPILLFLCGKRYLIQGIPSGGVKG